MVLLVCDQNLMKRQLAETRDSLNKMAALNQSLVEDKMELNTHILQVRLLPACLPACLSGGHWALPSTTSLSQCVCSRWRQSWLMDSASSML